MLSRIPPSIPIACVWCAIPGSIYRGNITPLFVTHYHSICLTTFHLDFADSPTVKFVFSTKKLRLIFSVSLHSLRHVKRTHHTQTKGKKQKESHTKLTPKPTTTCRWRKRAKSIFGNTATAAHSKHKSNCTRLLRRQSAGETGGEHSERRFQTATTTVTGGEDKS